MSENAAVMIETYRAGRQSSCTWLLSMKINKLNPALSSPFRPSHSDYTGPGSGIEVGMRMSLDYCLKLQGTCTTAIEGQQLHPTHISPHEIRQHFNSGRQLWHNAENKVGIKIELAGYVIYVMGMPAGIVLGSLAGFKQSPLQHPRVLVAPSAKPPQ